MASPPRTAPKNTAYYSFDQGPVRCIVLDSVNPNGYADGSIDEPQFAWLKQLLAASTDKYVFDRSATTPSNDHDQPAGPARGSTSTRASWATRSSRRCWPPERHRLGQRPHPPQRGHGAHAARTASGGFWEINTASHIDFPQQSRLIELADNRDGTLSIFTTMVDHAGPAVVRRIAVRHGRSWRRWPASCRPMTRRSATSAQEGGPTDRNTELLLNDPSPDRVRGVRPGRRRRAGRRRRRCRCRGCRARSSGCPWRSAGGRTPARPRAATRSTWSPASG